MLDQWEAFEAGPNEPLEERLYVSLNGKGQILLSRKAVEILGKPAAVRLFFSKVSSKIGIKAAKRTEKGAFPLNDRPQAHSKMIHSSPFCRNYGIRVTGTVAFNGIEVDNDNMLILDLNQTSRVSRVTAR